MAKLKSFSQRSSQKLPSLSSGTSLPKAAAPKDVTGRDLTVSNTGSVVQALSFGALHTKVTGSGSSSQWGGLLGAAASGGSSSLLSSGLLSGGALGFVGKLLGLFGGSKSTLAAPTPFVMPASQQQTLNVGSSAASSIALGVQSSPGAGGQNGPAYQVNQTTDHAQSAQVVQIVKQALLTSSSLNDVISEI